MSIDGDERRPRARQDPLKEMPEGDVYILNDPWQGTGT